MADEQLERGLETRRAVLGAEHVARARGNATAFTADFQDFITRYAWDAVWNRPGLDRRTRSMLVVAMMAALGRLEELRLHVRASVNTGVTRDEVKEILLQVAVYAGVPAANTAYHIAADVYKQLDEAAG